MTITTIRPLITFSSFVMLCMTITCTQSAAQCTASGPRSALSFSNDNSIGSIAYNSPVNADASDNSRATASATLSVLIGNSNYLRASNFGFSIPASATICGIVVEVEKSATNVLPLTSWVTDNAVRLIKGGTITGNNYATGAYWPITDGYYGYGGVSDLWGATWTPADINSSSFGVAFSASVVGIIGLLASARVDHIRVTVHYFDIPLPLSVTSFRATPHIDHSAQIEWNSAGNHDIETFIVQRSDNGADWASVYNQRAEVLSHGRSYYFTDRSCVANAALYRLQVQYSSGKTVYSHIIKVKWKQELFSVYPNPAASYLNIELKEPAKFFRCVATDGRAWTLSATRVIEGPYRIDISRLPRGSYILQVNGYRKLFIKN